MFFLLLPSSPVLFPLIGINTKVAQTVAYELGIPLSSVIVTASSSGKIGNMSNTGGSGTSETVCGAAVTACATLNASLDPLRKANPTWAGLIAAADAGGINLTVTGIHFPVTEEAGKFFTYFVYNATCSVVELDVLTGVLEILSVDMVYDCGQSLSPLIDLGQIEGAFVTALGFFFTEQAFTSPQGRLIANGTWDYKIPCSQDIPISFNVTLLNASPNQAPGNVLGSKATGEPPLLAACSAFFAAKEAIKAARSSVGNNDTFRMDTPATPAVLQALCLASPTSSLAGQM